MSDSTKEKLSQDLVVAYRTWFAEEKNKSSRPDSVVFMDDLSDVKRDCVRNEWKEIFKEAINRQDVFNPVEILKIEQSLAFSDCMYDPPTKESIVACGGVMGNVSEAYLKEIDAVISDLQEIEKLPSDFPFDADPKEFATSIIKSGLDYLKSYIPDLPAVEPVIRSLNPDSPFGAQVITDEDGRIVCELRVPDRLHPKFVDTVIHEFLGHVLHFTVLKQNTKLQKESPHLLCLTLHTHEPFFIEGVAQLTQLYLLNDPYWKFAGKNYVILENARFRRSLGTMSMLLSQIFSKSIDAEEAVKYHASLISDKNVVERLPKVYQQNLQDLFLARVRLNFSESLLGVAPLLTLSQSNFYRRLGLLMKEYYTPDSIREAAREHAL